jgi:hypothetical protein
VCLCIISVIPALSSLSRLVHSQDSTHHHLWTAMCSGVM